MKRWFGLLSALFLATAAHTFFPASLAAIGAPGQNFDGLGSGFTGPGGTMAVDTASPDPTGEVGPNHYVQAVNAQLAVFNKNGAALLGPVPLNSLWSGFGGDCETNNDGHANVLYRPARRSLGDLASFADRRRWHDAAVSSVRGRVDHARSDRSLRALRLPDQRSAALAHAVDVAGRLLPHL